MCCSFASASFTSIKPLRWSKSVDHLNSKICTICRAQLIAKPSFGLPQKQSMKRDTGSRLYCLSWILSTGIVTCISRAFSARFFSVQILRNSSRLHSVLILLPLSSVTYSSLLCGLFVACILSCRCLQMEWWAAVSGVAIPSQHALLMWPYLSTARLPLLWPQASRAFLHNWGKTENSNLHGFGLHRPSSKGTKSLFQAITAMKHRPN